MKSVQTRKDGVARPTHGLVVAKYQCYAVVKFHVDNERRQYREAFEYRALTVVKTSRRRVR